MRRACSKWRLAAASMRRTYGKWRWEVTGMKRVYNKCKRRYVKYETKYR